MYYTDENYKNIPIPVEFEEVYTKCPNALIYDGNNFSIDEDAYCSYVKCVKKESIQEKWQSIVDDGYTNNGNKYNYDDETLAIIAARLAHCNSTTNLGDAELVFYNSDKEPITFADKASIVQFFEDFITSRNHIDQNKLSLKAQVEACATKEEVEAIDITVGW